LKLKLKKILKILISEISYKRLSNFSEQTT